MRLKLLVLSLALGVPALGWAQDAGIALCQDDLSQNRQPVFTDPDAGLSLGAVTVTGTGDLRLNTGLAVLNPEQIVLPFDQTVSISFVAEAAGASQTLGWLYYDDLIARGYINTNGTPTDSSDDTLVDSDGDGIPDFHADIYNMGFTRPYVGVARRCAVTFAHAGFNFYMPELANQTCAGYFGSEALLDDLPPYANAARPVVGQISPAGPYTAPADQFSDHGLFPQVPNLLEPRHPLNNLMGLGHLVFLNADDDNDFDSYGPNQHFTPAADVLNVADDGIPDYNVTAYNSDGVPLVPPPDALINGADRTVNLGLIQANREIVLFILNYGDKAQEPTRALASGGPRVLPCLRVVAGTCALHLRTPVAVYFTKSALNMDQNPLLTVPAAERNIGCPNGSTCPVTTGGNYAGWLDPPALTRLNTPTYGNLAMPLEYAQVPRPPNNKMPHVIVGAPSTDPFRWILSFENTAGGGDRDFNDITFMINKSNGGGVTSGVVSGDISPTIAPDFTITQIRFQRTDDVTRGLPGPPQWFEVAGHAGACAGLPAPAINYFLAVDCRICSAGTCTPNPTPSWFPVVFPAATPNVVVLNPLDLGFTGSQLCWRADFVSPNQYCEPTINAINVGYQATKSGNYSRAAVSPIANAVLFGSQETPGITWIGAPTSATPAPTIRVYDGKKDFSPRGHLDFTTLYDPEATSVDNVVNRWDGGGYFTQAALNPSTRVAYTSDNSNNRQSLSSGGVANVLFPQPASCLPTAPPHDLNADGLCDGNDATFLASWLLGWENINTAVKRAWPMGGLQFSTPAFVGPPSMPIWMVNATEQAAFTANFSTLLVNREAQTYVGTVSGVLHAFDSGLLRLTDDACTTAIEQRGFFEHVPADCSSTVRNYGNGHETFAYFPRLMLNRYVNNYTGLIPSLASSTSRAEVDASATVIDVDLAGLGAGTPAWTISRNPGVGAKTALVTASGQNAPVIFGLDVTNDPAASAGTYPIPMFELDTSVFANNFNAPAPPASIPPVPIDGTGTRHAPFVGRFNVVTTTGPATKWLAVVPTDYAPAALSAGTVYFIDLTTGLPLNLGTAAAPKPAVVPLEVDQGLGGEALAVDLDADGSYDTVYVPSVSGKVWRISLTQLNATAPAGQELLRCVVADAQQTLELSGPMEPAGTQHIYSNIAVKVTRPSGVEVEIFFGTADNPDDPTDPMSTHYYIVNAEDPTPGAAACAAGLGPTQITQLDPDQRVWGGVSIDQDQVFVATAVGSAADACNLDPTTSGNLYVLNQTNLTVVSTTPLNGQAISTPVMYDGHLFVARMNGGPQVIGGSTHNNPIGGATLPRSRVLTWDSAFNGKLPQ